MTPTQTAAIVRAATAWVQAHDRRMAASRIKRQMPAFHPDSYRAGAAVTEAKRLERAALRALHLAVLPRAINIRASEVLELVQLQNTVVKEAVSAAD